MLPIIKVRISSRAPPYMSPLVKYFCKIGNKNSRSHRQSENHVLQEWINLSGGEQIRAVNERRSYHTSSKRWWDTVIVITCRQARNAPVSFNLLLTRKQVSYFSSLSILTISTPHPKSFPSRMYSLNWGAYSMEVSEYIKAHFSVSSTWWTGGIMLINLRQQSPKYLTPFSRNSCSPVCGSGLILHLFPKRLLSKRNQLRPISLSNVIMTF